MSRRAPRRVAGLVFAEDYPKFLLGDSAIWPIIEHMNESREDELALALPSNTRTLFDTLAAARKARIAAEALELDTIHRLCLAFHAVDEDAFGEAAEKLIYHGADGTPAVAEYLSLEVSALLGISPGSGATLIGDGVAALIQLDAAQFGDVAVLDIDQAGGDLAAEDALGGLRHGGSCLACSDHVEMAEAGEVAAFQVAGDGVGRTGRGERGAEDGQGVAAESSGGHGEIREGDCGFNAET